MRDTSDPDEEAREFWKGFIKDEGEVIVAKSMGALKTGKAEDEKLWGLLVLTDRRFVFREMPSDRTLLGFKLPGQDKKPKAPIVLELSLGEIDGLEEGPKGFWARLFGPPFPPFALAWKETDLSGVQTTRQESFAHDPATGFVARLREALEQRA